MAPGEREERERRDWWRHGAGRAVAVALCSLYLVICLVPLFYGILAFEVRCGDDCGQGSGWTQDGQAWQWIPFGFIGIGTFLAAAVLLVAVVARSERLSRRALVASAACVLGLATLNLTHVRDVLARV